MSIKKEEKIKYTEYLDRSSKGQWFRGILKDNFIEIYWKPVFRKHSGKVIEYDFNGCPLEYHDISNVNWRDEWRLGGKIELKDDMVNICGIENFEKFSFGLMVHAICLLTCGFGESIDGITCLFEDISSLDFIASDRYTIISDHGNIQDLSGCLVDVEIDDGYPIVRISVGGDFYEIDVRNNENLTSFVICTKPI